MSNLSMNISTFFLLRTPFTLILGVSASSSPSMKSLTPHLGISIMVTVSWLSSPVTSRPANSWNLLMAWSSFRSAPTLLELLLM